MIMLKTKEYLEVINTNEDVWDDDCLCMYVYIDVIWVCMTWDGSKCIIGGNEWDKNRPTTHVASPHHSITHPKADSTIFITT